MERKVATESDFNYFRSEALDMSSDWICAYDKENIQVLLKDMSNSDTTRVKARAVFEDISPDIMYKVVIHDEYVRHYDGNMAEWVILEQIDNSNDISYYASKLPSLITFFISPRDFLSQRAYGQTGKDEYMLMMRSIEDTRMTPRKKWVRAHIYLTGFLIRKNPNGEGTELIYISQTDLKGKIPSKVVNFATSKFAPNIMTQFREDARKFPHWEKTGMKTETLPIYPAYEGAQVE